MNTVEILKAAKAKIVTPDKWCKGALARSLTGHKVEPESAEACFYCATGAVSAVSHQRGPIDYLRRALGAAAQSDIWVFNDSPSTAHADILALFDKAIALAEKEKA